MCNDFTLTVEELEDYAKLYGNTAAASLLLLTPPDRFEGDYEETLAKYAGKQ